MTINYTLSSRSDGFGAQYQSIMSGIAYCKFKNYNYIHTTLKNVCHNADVESLNKFMGIPTSNRQHKIDITESFSKIVHQCKNPSKYYTKDVIKF